MLNKYQILETIREDGPSLHQKKQGTPSMGGIIIILSIILPAFLWTKFLDPYIFIILLSTLWMGIIGFIDDYLKIIKKKSQGLIARYKLGGQILLGFIISYILQFHPIEVTFHNCTSIPFIANGYIDLYYFYIPLIIIVIIASSNAVNLTDGLDGLSVGLSIICIITFGIIAYLSGRFDYSNYLNIIYLPNSGELLVYCAALIGSCMGFLWFNSYPAKIFMGDTGSLALGATIGTLAILLKKEILLILVGFVFVLETISVIIQVLYFKYTKKNTGTGRKYFKMAPIHHHFELSGWHENHIVVRFWILGVICALLSLLTFKVQ